MNNEKYRKNHFSFDHYLLHLFWGTYKNFRGDKKIWGHQNSFPSRSFFWIKFNGSQHPKWWI